MGREDGCKSSAGRASAKEPRPSEERPDPEVDETADDFCIYDEGMHMSIPRSCEKY
jgi:hypothetical protein